MANQEHLGILQQGINVWNSWRKKHPDIRPDLYGADLREADLMLVDFSGVDLSHADLSYADLSFSDLSYADLSLSILSYADLSGTNFSEAVLYRAILYEANLCGADFHKADFSEADLSRVDVSGTNLREAIFNGAIVPEANLEQALLGDNPGLEQAQERALNPPENQPPPDPPAAEPLPQKQSAASNGTAPFLAAKQPEPSQAEKPLPPLDYPDGQAGKFTVLTGLTQALFNNQLYVTVKSTNGDSAGFILGSVGHPSTVVDVAEVGHKIIYLEQFEVYLVSVDSLGATFVVNRVEESNSVEEVEYGLEPGL